MGQKVHPIGMRLGIVKEHTSIWYADRKAYAEKLVNDLEHCFDFRRLQKMIERSEELYCLESQIARTLCGSSKCLLATRFPQHCPE